MIIKSWSGKDAPNKDNFKKVLQYIHKNAEKDHTIEWNLNETEIKKITEEFKENSTHTKKRKN